MKIFISWSGQRSRELADALYVWLPRVIQSVTPWISTHDIGKGSRFMTEIARELNEHAFGLICVTPENKTSTWLHFEAGALSKTDDSRTYTLLLGLGYSEIEQPLAQFNHTLATETDMRQLIESINAALEKPLARELWEHSFKLNWPELQDRITAIEKQTPPTDVAVPVPRDDQSMLREILELLRSQTRRTYTPSGAKYVDEAPVETTALRDMELLQIAGDALEALGRVSEVVVQRAPDGGCWLRFTQSGSGIPLRMRIPGGAPLDLTRREVHSFVQRSTLPRRADGASTQAG